MAIPAPGRTRVALENKGRGGKSVTVVRGLALAPDALLVLAIAGIASVWLIERLIA